MKRVMNIDANEIKIDVIGRNGSGKATIALMVVDFLRANGLVVGFISSTETEESELRESHKIDKMNHVLSSVRKLTVEDVATEKPPVNTKETYRLIKDLFGCPTGRLFEEDINGDFTHVMSDEEKTDGTYFPYMFPRKHVLNSVGEWFELV